MEAFTGTGEEWVVVFNSINVALFQLVQVIKYTASSEARNIHVTAWVNLARLTSSFFRMFHPLSLYQTNKSMLIHRLLLTATVCLATSLDGDADAPLDETQLMLREFLSSEDFISDVRARIEPNDLIQYKLSGLSSNSCPAFKQVPEAPVGSWSNPLGDKPSEVVLKPFAGAKGYLEIPADSYANYAKEKLLSLWAQVSCAETSIAVADPSQSARAIDGLFDKVNVGLYQLVQELNYMTSSEAPNEDVAEYISLITQMHYRSALFFASPTAVQEWGPFSESLGYSLWTLIDRVREGHSAVAQVSRSSPVNFPDYEERAYACAMSDEGPSFRMRAENEPAKKLEAELQRKMEEEAMKAAMVGAVKEDLLEDVFRIGMHFAEKAFGKATTTLAPTTTVAPTPDPVIAQKRCAALTAFTTAVTKDIDFLTDMIIAVETISGTDENAFSLQIASLRSAVLSKHCSILAAAGGAGVLSKQQLMPISDRLGSIPKRLKNALRVVEWPPVRDDVHGSVQLLRTDVLAITV